MVDFTSIALGALLFVVCMTATLMIVSPMIKDMSQQELHDQLSVQFAESEAGLERVANIEGFQDDESQDITTYVSSKLEDIPENPGKGEFMGAAIKISGMAMGVLLRFMFLQDILPADMMVAPFGAIFKMVVLIPFWIATAWVIMGLVRSFIPFVSGGGSV